MDPRDIGWEIESPSYRVYFWEQPPRPPHVPGYVSTWRSNEFELSEVDDVTEVLDWAKATAPPGGTYVVYAVVEGAAGRGLVRLAGVDPLASSAM